MRTKSLLSGVSTLAIVAALGSAAQAADTKSGPNTIGPYTNAQTDSVTFNTDLTVQADATTGDSFYNSLSMSAAGANLTIDDSFLLGDIVNAGTMTSTGGIAIDILNDSQVGGELFNSGGILGNTIGISLVGDSTIGRGIRNTGSITGGSTAVLLGDDSEIFAGITNAGYIAGNIGINVTDAQAELQGGINNTLATSKIIGLGTAAIQMSAGTITGGIDNHGTIQGQNAAEGIVLTGGTLAGGISNRTGALISTTDVSNTAILIDGATFNGNLTNDGQIRADASSALGIVITGASVFTGNVVNNGSAVVSAFSTALLIDNTTFTGNVANSGAITSASGDAIVVSAATFTGNVTNNTGGVVTGHDGGIFMNGTTFTGTVINDGSITVTGPTGTGVMVSTTTFTGNVVNNGRITATGTVGNGVAVDLGTTLTGNVTNAAGARIVAGNIGALVAGTLAGTLTNAGTIQGVTGVDVTGRVTGGIANSGTITGTAKGIDLSGADTATTITQTAGLIRGNNGGTITTALDLVNGLADTVNANGGTIDGNITGTGADDVIMSPGSGGTFSYLRGTSSGLDQFDMAGAGTAVLGAALRGSTGAGVTIGATSMTHNGAGTLYLDDNTRVNLSGTYTQTSGTLEFQLTSDVLTHGTIAAANAVLGGRLAAYIQGDTFGTAGGNTFTYQNVITGTTSGTFANTGTIDTNSIFFTGHAVINAADVDIVLNRKTFTSALALPGLSQNQQAVGGAIEGVYSAGGYSTEFEDLFNYLLSLPAGQEAKVAHIYDELSGAEHADLQEVGLRVSHTFNDMIGGRLTDIRGSQQMADLGLRRYAEAAPSAANDGMSSAPRMRDSLGMAVWGRGYGSWTNVDSDAEAAGYDQNSGGFAGGLDFAVDRAWRIGGAIGWSSANVDFATLGDTADVDSFQFAGYGAYEGERFYGDAALSFGFHDLTTTRLIDLGGAGTEVASANYNATTWGAHGEFGARFEMGTFDFEAFVGAAYGSQSTDGFAETGAGGFSLLVQDANADSLASTVGARFSGEWQAGGVRLVPKAEVAWRHEFMDERQSFSAAFLEDPTSQFQIVSTALSRDSAVVGLGIGAQVSKGLVLFLDYDGLFNGTSNTHAASAGLRASW